jgi:hypothetical protein
MQSNTEMGESMNSYAEVSLSELRVWDEDAVPGEQAAACSARYDNIL